VKMQSQIGHLKIDRAFPFSAVVGQDNAKLALTISVVDPEIGGVLLTGPKGSGKSLLVNGLERILPTIEVVDHCRYNCAPKDRTNMCQECRSRLKEQKELPAKQRKMRVVRLPIGATEDRVLGGVDLEKAVAQGVVSFQPGLLAEANRNILYVDQINLLSEHLVDSLLDAAASGWTRVEREGVSTSHPSRFILIGSMNPEEGELRPQIMDRFSLHAPVQSEENPELREEILKRNMEFDQDPSAMIESCRKADEELSGRLAKARSNLQSVKIPGDVGRAVAKTCSELRVDGHRPDIVTLRAARAIAAYAGRQEVTAEDVLLAAELSLTHRPRSLGTMAPASTEEIRWLLQSILPKDQAPKPVVSSQPPKSQQEAVSAMRLPQMAPRLMRRLSHREFLLRVALAVLMPILYFVLAMTTVTLFILSVQGIIGIPFTQTLEAYWLHFWGAIVAVFLFMMAFLYRQREPLYVPDLQAQQLSRLLVEKQIISDEAYPGLGFDLLEGTGPVFQLVPLEIDVKVPKIAAYLDKGSKTLANLFRSSRPRRLDKDFVPSLERKVHPIRRYVVGKHSKAESRSQVGRYVSYEMPRGHSRDIAFGPTIRAAAIRARSALGKMPRVRIAPSDMRVKIREHKVPLSILLVLDMSESMISSLDNVSKSILSLHRTASRKRDRVGLVVFKGSEAVLLQHATRNLRQVVKKLLDLGASDFTPLAAGMLKALHVLRAETSRNKDSIPVMVVITDGIVNIPLSQPISSFTRKAFANSAQADVVDVARMISRHGIRTIIINTDHRDELHPEDTQRKLKWLTPTELLTEVARITRGRYYGLVQEGAAGPVPQMPGQKPVTLVAPLVRQIAKRSVSTK